MQAQELDSLRTKLADNVRLAQQLRDEGAVKSGVEQVWAQYASFSGEREKDIDSSLARMAEKLLPPAHQYFVHSAEKGQGLYAPPEPVGVNEEEKEMDDGGFEGQFMKRDSDQGEVNMADRLKLRPEDMERIKGKRQEIAALASTIRTKAKKLTEDKEEVVKEVRELDKLIHDTFYSKLTPDAALEFVEWVDAVLSEDKTGSRTRASSRRTCSLSLSVPRSSCR
ncbi:MAG: hypothetical protein P4L10_14185 [Acidobacteriaceae bacterium]|nr:hypothetical protein [Acidobacteriaceae bacterium]